MGKFKPGQYIRHRKVNAFVEGVVIGVGSGCYTVLTPEGKIKSPPISIIDGAWIIDENKTVDLILKKYNYEVASS